MISAGSIPFSRHGTARTSTSIPTPPREAVSEVAHVEAGSAEVLDADDQTRVEQLEARLDEALLLERVADLHRGSLRRVGVAFRKAGGGQDAHAADAVAPGRGSQQDGEVADAARLAEHESLAGQEAEAQHVDERVASVGLVEHDLPADRRHADGVAVTGDATDDTFRDPSAAGVVEGPEAQRVHERDRSGTHREDVAEDAADTGGGALIRLDRGRVVVALDAYRRGDAVAHIDDARVLARPDDHPRGLGGKSLQMSPR